MEQGPWQAGRGLQSPPVDLKIFSEHLGSQVTRIASEQLHWGWVSKFWGIRAGAGGAVSTGSILEVTAELHPGDCPQAGP